MISRRLLRDGALLGASVALAVFIVRSGAVEEVLAYFGDGVFWLTFISGVFFTSIFTAAPAAVVLGELAEEENLVFVSLVGGLGAMVGDYVLFLFMRKRVAEEARFLVKNRRVRAIRKLIKRWHFQRLMPLFGFFLLASPLPDEPALAFMGLSKIRTESLLALTFFTHATGIFAIGLIARSVGG
jgi:membrane protein DedA with SNARE-associated domain